MSNKQIAVLSSNFYGTLDWLKSDYFKQAEEEIQTVIVTRKLIKTKNGNEYYIVSSRMEILGLLFDDFVISPTYDDLVNLIQSRLRKENNANSDQA